MPDAPWFTLHAADGRTTLRLAGAWRLPRLPEIEAALTGIDTTAPLMLLRTLTVPLVLAGRNALPPLAPAGRAAADWEGRILGVH